MIKVSAVKRILEEVILNEIIKPLESFGFKYLKSQQLFKRSVNHFDQIISFDTPYDPIEYNDQTGEFWLNLDIRILLKSPKLDRWVKKKLKQHARFRHDIELINSFAILHENNFKKEDFYIPNESQNFKNYIFSNLKGADIVGRIALREFIDQLPKKVDMLDRNSSGLTLVAQRQNQTLDYLRLLAFEGELEIVKKHYVRLYDTIKAAIYERVNSDVKAAKIKIKELESLIAEAGLLFDLQLENPFKRTIKPCKIQNLKLRLGNHLGYQEVLRFDISMIDVKSFDINDFGEILILKDDGSIVKIDQSGEVIEIGQLRFNECFENNFDLFRVKWMEEANCFVCNNFIVLASNELIELVLDFDHSRYKNNSIRPNVRSFLYDEKSQQFHLLFSPENKVTYHFIYDENGELLSKNRIERNCIRINLNRKEFVATSNNNSVDVVDFNGNFKQNYKYPDGNDRVTMSPDGKFMLLHFYSPKSQLFLLEEQKKKVLWGHPTYIKRYKDQFYNDINHNFGLNYCTFTPDGKNIIGGADHGKYIRWDTAKFERHELIPSEESMPIFNWFTTIIRNETSTRNYFKPYKANLDGQAFFVNRGYELSKVSFVENGKYMITQVSDCLLVWDAEFENIGHAYGVGEAIFSKEKYLILNKDDKLILFKSVSNFDNDFESSLFKAIEGENSNITYM